MAVDDTSERWPEVGRRITARIEELSLLLSEVQRAAGISDKTLTGYMAGRPIVRADKRRGLCAALGWSDDSIARILRGDDPEPRLASVAPAAGDRSSDTDLASRVAALDPEDQRYVDGIIDALERKKRGEM